MKKLNHILSASVLILVLSVAAFAGIIECPAPPPPPPDPSASAAAGDTATPGDIWIPGAPSDPVADAALNLLQSFFTVF